MMSASWKMRTPTLLLTTERDWKKYEKDGVVPPVGYRWGIAFPENTNITFEAYTREKYLAFLERSLQLKNAPSSIPE
jgi:hypothetical protein